MPVRSYIREHYRNEQRGICAYCKNPISFNTAGNAHVEHIVPKSLHIDFIFEEKNLCVICADCNTIKRDQETLGSIPNTLAPSRTQNTRRRYPRSSNAFLIVHPHFDEWDQHIIKFGVRYTDRSEKGAFTIKACKLNRFFHKNFDVDESFLDDSEIMGMMSKWIDSKSSMQKTEVLLKLADSLSKMNL
ncbi:HNH endonuclease [Pseudomonas sp. NUPR-001]|uniref:HNH endonuclease n=1 Tax=Pseudomonas sp. NUPR-001 TaxID=3416058 RepID=UPI003F96562B